jgi:acetaldehyde dehydrogenase
VIGPGKIGQDLCERLLVDSDFELVTIISSNSLSRGLKFFRNKVDHLVDNEITGLPTEVLKNISGFFDCSTAESARQNWDYIKNLQKWVIDLTPSNIGFQYTPFINAERYKKSKHFSTASNFSMVSCGGQSSAPIIFAICENLDEVEEVEVSSSIASVSAGMATRNNIDNYIQTTEDMIGKLVECENVKVILVLNPSNPPTSMRTTITIKGKGIDPTRIQTTVESVINDLKKFVPGVELIYQFYDSSLCTYSVSLLINGSGISLPKYAGNLDIINVAAIETARQLRFKSESLDLL